MKTSKKPEKIPSLSCSAQGTDGCIDDVLSCQTD